MANYKDEWDTIESRGYLDTKEFENYRKQIERTVKKNKAGMTIPETRKALGDQYIERWTPRCLPRLGAIGHHLYQIHVSQNARTSAGHLRS